MILIKKKPLLSRERVLEILKEDNFDFEEIRPLCEKIVGHPISPFFTVPSSKKK